MNNQVKLEPFYIKSGKMIISDPCYDPPEIKEGMDSCNAILPVKIGKWIPTVFITENWGTRISKIVVKHEDTPPYEDFHQYLNKDNENNDENTLGVDSGQLGFFDQLHFKDDSIATPELLNQAWQDYGDDIICPETPWYSLNCAYTINNDTGAGTIPFGVVTSSGFGDGSYKLYAILDPETNTYTAFEVTFIEDNQRNYDTNEDEEDDYYEEEEEEFDDEEDDATD